MNRELLSQRRWPDKWGFLANEYRQVKKKIKKIIHVYCRHAVSVEIANFHACHSNRGNKIILTAITTTTKTYNLVKNPNWCKEDHSVVC